MRAARRQINTYILFHFFIPNILPFDAFFIYCIRTSNNPIYTHKFNFNITSISHVIFARKFIFISLSFSVAVVLICIVFVVCRTGLWLVRSMHSTQAQVKKGAEGSKLLLLQTLNYHV